MADKEYRVLHNYYLPSPHSSHNHLITYPLLPLNYENKATNQPTLCSRLLLQWSSAGQEIPHPEGSFLSSQKPTPTVSILSPVNPACASSSYFLKIHVSCNGFTPSGLPIKPLFSSPVHTSCPVHLLLSHLINLILSGK
jgi:hypothetical protein